MAELGLLAEESVFLRAGESTVGNGFVYVCKHSSLTKRENRPKVAHNCKVPCIIMPRFQEM
jgi:hypothetical protein